MSRAPLVNLVVVGAICYVVWDYVALWTILLWAGTVLTSEVIRAIYARRTLARMPDNVDRALNNMLWIALLVGCARGSAMPLFFAQLPPVAHAALSTTFLGFCAGGLSTHGAYARAFYFFASPMLVALGIAWASTGTKEGVVLTILFGVFALMIAVFAKEIERLVRESFFIRYQRDSLVEQLEQERQQVVLARDKAEHASNAKSRFLAAASHDLRQPLHALSLFSATLSKRAKSAEVDEIAGSISKALRSLSALVDAVLDISKLDAQAVEPKLKAVEIMQLLDCVKAEFGPSAVAKGLSLEVRTFHVAVQTDPVLAAQILRNLVDNAIKYTREGYVRVEMVAEGERLRISVADSGEGIPEGEREQIFEEFYQIGNPERDRTKGLGLGLAIVRRVGKLLGTEIVVSSEVGLGSTFTLWLPLATDLPSVRADEVRQVVISEESLAGRCILVIDDEPDIRIAMRRLLEEWKCRVFACAGLTEAIELIESHAPDIDMIVADFRLRSGENGIATVEALRKRLGTVSAVLVSGDTAPERLREADASGLPILHKPVPPDALRNALVEGLSR
jgi:signal transduction histidine kinase/CheY-like chemotaxis protein